ncbi:MAG: hypothetical protein NTW98_01200 [Candidatus Nomurabacteria bacterium]|nr:hypothetical protein [Candidatus Nomurabacteria bacterium]
MTEEEAKKEIDKIYDEAFNKLRVLEHEQDVIIKRFMDKLKEEKIKNEQDKIRKIREELLAKDNF